MIVPYMLRLLSGRRALALAAVLVMMSAEGWLVNMPAHLIGRAVDEAVVGEPTALDAVRTTLTLIAACVAGILVIQWARRYIVENIATRIEQSEFVGLVRHLLRLELASFTRERIGGLNVRVHRSVSGVIALIRLAFSRFLPIAITAGFAIAFAAPRHYAIALIMLGALFAGAAMTIVQIASQKGVRLALLGLREANGAKVNELLWGLEYVRAHGLQEYEVGETRKLAEQLRRRSLSHVSAMISIESFKLLIEWAGLIAVIGVGTALAVDGAVTRGDVLAFVMLYRSATHPMMELYRIVDEAFEAGLRVRELIELRERPVDAGLHGTAAPEADGETVLQARSLGVVHRARPGAQAALRDVALTVRRREVVGVAGPSGAGKSTLMAALMGLISDYSGSLTVFGREVRDLDKDELARLVSYVPQVPFIFKGTLRDNLRYAAHGEPTDRELMEALEKARLGELFQRLPAGLDSMIGEQGRDLSGGERQRLMLARVFLRRRGLVVLDEATSSLDSENEQLVQQSLAELTASAAATFIVAHRLSTLTIADRIIVLHDGAIVQEGTFAALSSSPGLFRDLLAAQDGRPGMPRPGGRPPMKREPMMRGQMQ